jgi:hypothetical protein
MAVARIEAHISSEIVSLLRALTARAVRGELVGGAMCFMTDKGAEHCIFTGTYKRKPALGVNATVRMVEHLLRMQDDMHCGSI